MVEESLWIGLSGTTLVVAPEGHMTAALCPVLTRRLGTFLGPDSRVAALRLDFSRCQYMDSTFLGLIVSIAKKAQALGLGKPIVHRADAQCMSLFRTMGMVKLLQFEESPCPRPETMEALGERNALRASFILDAHQELMSLSPENEERFRALAGALEEALQSESGDHEKSFSNVPR